MNSTFLVIVLVCCGMGAISTLCFLAYRDFRRSVAKATPLQRPNFAGRVRSGDDVGEDRSYGGATPGDWNLADTLQHASGPVVITPGETTKVEVDVVLPPEPQRIEATVKVEPSYRSVDWGTPSYTPTPEPAPSWHPSGHSSSHHSSHDSGSSGSSSWGDSSSSSSSDSGSSGGGGGGGD